MIQSTKCYVSFAKAMHVDTFNVYYLQQLISKCQQNEAVAADKSIKEYENKKEGFLEATTVKQFPTGYCEQKQRLSHLKECMAEMRIRIPSTCMQSQKFTNNEGCGGTR